MTTENCILVGQLVVLLVQLLVLGLQAYFLCESLKATKLSAEAAKKSADVAEKSVNDIERPYVLVESVREAFKEYMDKGDDIIVPIDAQIKPHAVLILKNYGRSPALVSKLGAHIHIIDGGCDLPDTIYEWLENIIVIGPHETFEKYVAYYNAHETGVWNQVKRGELKLFVVVSLFYRDVLSKEHQTKLKFLYDTHVGKFVIQDDTYTIRT